MARDIRQRLLNDAEHSGCGKFTQGNVAIAQHKFTGDARIPDKFLHQPLQCGNDAKIQSPRPQARRDMPCGLDGAVHQLCHGLQARHEFWIGLAKAETCQRNIHPQRGKRLSQFIVNFACNAFALFLTHAFKMRRKLAQHVFRIDEFLFAGFAFGNIDCNTIPHAYILAVATRGGAQVDPSRLAIRGNDTPFPIPERQLFLRLRQTVMEGVHIIRDDEADECAVFPQDRCRIQAQQPFRAIADVSELEFATRMPATLEHHARHIGGDAMKAFLAFAQYRFGALKGGNVARDGQDRFNPARCTEFRDGSGVVIPDDAPLRGYSKLEDFRLPGEKHPA